ncbi:MAG: CDP-diacylglycerol--glycerol-3-phosphate 3-phosphatidyltransferase [Clostridia bacterium]|jgi:CDP-diacylglycerol--glycerol-3-phosphate 3-phosphatidyltransferase|nr:CDP-diacylglycerol--glycerol-3-phosphate 3-phosphatidyltransferase [Clostridia bacterium]
MSEKKKILNVPNTLSLLRVILVPVFMATLIFMNGVGANRLDALSIRIIPALTFAITAFTDMLDGKIARKYNLITNFGKFIDPLADKFMVFGALIAMLVAYKDIAPVFVWVSMIVMLRELAITSLRLVIAGNSGKVLAASWWGKVKTATQSVSIFLIVLEPAIYTPAFCPHLISYIAMAAITITTIGSGIDYCKAYFPLINTNE